MRTWTSLAAILVAVSGLASDLEINPDQRLLQHAGDGVAVPIGMDVSGLSFRDTAGAAHYAGDGRNTVFVFLSTSCPLAKRYTGRMNRMHQEFVERGVDLVGVFSNMEDDFESVVAHAERMKFVFPTVKDEGGYLAQRLGAVMTPQAVLVDAAGEIRYRGALDDNRYENRVKQRYLREAIGAIVSGESVPRAETKVLGCSIHLDDSSDVEQVTYTQHVSRILQDNCQSCHRPGQVAPFSLTNYKEAKTWATEINAYSQSRLMPPWKAAAEFGNFKHERRLTDDQLELLDRWVKSEMKEGPAEALPPTPQYSDQWQLGTPDDVLIMPEEYTIGPEGEDDYRHFIIPTNYDRDVFVRAAEFVPGNRQTVHHVIAYVDTSGKARKLDEQDPGPGYTRFGDVGFDPVSGLGGWAPGNRPDPTPPGTGFWLPKGADVVLQVHYYRTGVEETDRTKVGIYFCEDPDPVAIRTGMAINHRFKIPPDEERYQVNASWTIKEPIYAISVTPHMHLLGKEMKVVARLPDDRVEPLIWIKDWDFNWQETYRFADEILLPEGTKIELVSYFDNSAENVNNPHDPPKPVGWGEKTTDEMCIAFVTFLKASQWQPETTK